MKLSEVHPFHTFRPHPFKVRDDAKMQEIVASIRVNGVMVPGLARPEKDGNGYEIVAGHRRTHGSELAGLEEMPFIVRGMTDHEAVQAMKDSNKQRDGMLPSELAALLELEVEDIKHQGGRLNPYVYTVSFAPVSLIVTFRLSLPIPGIEARARPLSYGPLSLCPIL